MRLYRRLNPIKALSFDLDDTLYDNWPIILKAEQAQLNYLHQALPQTRSTDMKQWQTFRFALAKNNPSLSHDIGLLRQVATKQQLLQLGLNEPDAEHHSQQAFEAFYQQRIQVTIEPKIIDIMQQLSSKLPIIAITNGNACIDTMGLGKVFKFALLAGDKITEDKVRKESLEQKPSPDMFEQASKQLNINKQNILHIGDSQHSDIQGALKANYMAAWINPHNKPLNTQSGLPHIEFQQIEQLLGLI